MALLAGCVLGWLGGGTGHAEWDAEKYLIYSFGEVSLRPQLDLGAVYDSNLFYSATNAVDDIYMIVRPGLSFVYGERSLNFASLRYILDASLYTQRDDLNNVGHLINHDTRLKLARWNLQANDALSITRTLLGGSFGYIQKRVGLLSLNDLWRADYEMSPKALLGAKFGLEYADYTAKDLPEGQHLYDYLGYTLGARAGYLPSEKIVIYPEFTFGQSFLSPNLSANNPVELEAPDLDLFGVSVGAEGDFTPKLTGSVSGGYEIRKYSDDSDVPDGWVADLKVQWQARPKTSISVGYRHFIQVSREASGVPYTAHRPTLTINQELGTQSRWYLSLESFFQLHTYDEGFQIGAETVDREEDYLYAALRATWRWQPWLMVAGSYEFRSYSDNIESSNTDYDLHRISLRFIAGY